MARRRQIVSVEEPKEKGQWALWRVKFRYWNGEKHVEYFGDMFEEGYKVLMQEEKLIQAGCNAKDLEEYKDLVREECIRNEDEAHAEENG